MLERPLILALDTSAGHCATAVLAGHTVLSQTFESMKKGQAERLMTLLEETLVQHSLTFQDLDAIAVGTGPGNFTGIRIGVSAARGLALGLGIPAYGVDGFDQRADLDPSAATQSIRAPREQRYLRDDAGDALISGDDFAAKGYDIPVEPSPDALAASIARVARSRFPASSNAPAPYYLRAPDAAPSKIAAPTILP